MSNHLQEQARQHAIKAIEFDQAGDKESAIFYYLEASQALIDLKSENNTQTINSALKEYISRAEILKKQVNSNQKQQKSTIGVTKTDLQKDIEKGLCLLTEGVDQDVEGHLEEALELYTNAVEVFIKIPNKNQISQNNEKFQKLQRNINKAMERAEEIKKLQKKSETQKPTSNESIWLQKLDQLNVHDSDDDETDENPTVHNLAELNKKSSKSFTKDEIDVLRHGSTINQRSYVPFFPEIDAKERFFFPLPFTDKDGKLALSQSQKERFSRWIRPDEIYENPTLMMLVSSFSVKQTCISDCSFVASLTVCAQYERKFGKSLLSRIIYPQNKKGDPIFNPCGKYMVSLNLNGCLRKIIIDDYLPIDNNNQLLCSLTTNRGELWVSLLEKAYMKVMGGYDFPGSNSNIDLHSLTSWIPERISIKGDYTDFDKNSDFERMFERIHDGSCLITLATGPLTKDEETRTGLVPTHAYAVLDIRKFKEKRLFQLKNPWSHLRWKGNYSEYDINNWTNDLKNALNYDPNLACNVDNGIFWIDYESLMRFFDVFYLSWNPNLFQYTNSFQRKWSAQDGPIKDRYNLGENPQYVLKVKNQQSNANKKCTTWLLLTRHIVDKADFAENKEYIALVVYKSNGKRIYYPMEPAPFKEGVRINSPHYLVKLVDDEPGPILYTLVISQYEKYHSIYYSLKVYSTMPFELNEIKEPYKVKYAKKISGKWDQKTAGGCPNYRDTYNNNPQYQMTLTNSDTNNFIKIELKGPQQYSVGFDLACVNSNVANSNVKQTSSGDFRKGFCVLPLNSIPGGTYTIRPCTYSPGQEGPFFLEISSNREFILNQI